MGAANVKAQQRLQVWQGTAPLALIKAYKLCVMTNGLHCNIRHAHLVCSYQAFPLGIQI